MTRKERLMRSIRGESVDRPPVSFYEINGMEPMDDPDPFNIFNDPSWRPLIELARDRSDRIVQLKVPFKDSGPGIQPDRAREEKVQDEESIRWTTTIEAGSRTLRSRRFRERDVNTVWTTEHLLKGPEDIEAWLALPWQDACGTPDAKAFLKIEESLGDSGIAMVDIGDALCSAASLFSMEDYTVAALTEEKLFRRLLDRFQEGLLPRVEAIAKALPGRLWRIYGPEYASEPYLPPRLFKAYVTDYDKELVKIIKAHGGYPRIHSHGRLRGILDLIVETGCVGLDPIEPPPQGDMELSEVKAIAGKELTLFGNLEASDIEGLETKLFERKVRRALEEGPGGRGFVLMPSACPYGRKLSPLAMANYKRLIELVESL